MSRLGKSFKNRFLRRALAMVLAGTMVLSGMPVSFAAETSDAETAVETEVQGGTEETSEETAGKNEVVQQESEEETEDRKTTEETETAPQENESAKQDEESEKVFAKESAAAEENQETASADSEGTTVSSEIEETETTETGTEETETEETTTAEENEAAYTSSDAALASGHTYAEWGIGGTVTVSSSNSALTIQSGNNGIYKNTAEDILYIDTKDSNGSSHGKFDPTSASVTGGSADRIQINANTKIYIPVKAGSDGNAKIAIYQSGVSKQDDLMNASQDSSTKKTWFAISGDDLDKAECTDFGAGGTVNNKTYYKAEWTCTLKNNADSAVICVEIKDATNYAIKITSGEKVRDDVYTSTTGDSATLVKYAMEGYAKTYGDTGVTGGGVMKTDAANYHTVSTAEEFLQALVDIQKASAPAVIRITKNLNLGSKEVKNFSNYSAVITAHKYQALWHPTLKTTGVSSLNLKGFNSLTIFSTNGAAIRHCGITVNGSENIIFRNLVFDEFWEWDDGGSVDAEKATYDRGGYDRNDWDYITVDENSDGVWIDHCTFYKAYDGIIDVKKAKGQGEDERVTISWCKFEPKSAPKTVDGKTTYPFYDKQIDYLEEHNAETTYYRQLRLAKGESFETTYTKYTEVKNADGSKTINSESVTETLNGAGYSVDDIITYTCGQKKTHLLGQSDDDKSAMGIRVTLANNSYKNSMDRMPRLRFGKAHVYNCVLDASELYTAHYVADGGSKFDNHLVSNGASSNMGGYVFLENCYIDGIKNPLISGNGSSTRGCIGAEDSIYKLNGKTQTLTPINNSTGTDKGQAALTLNKTQFEAQLPSSYGTPALYNAADLNTKVIPYAGAGVLEMNPIRWTKTSYGDGSSTDNSSLMDWDASKDNDPAEDEGGGGEEPPTPPNPGDEKKDFSLKADELTTGDITQSTPQNGFTIKATNDKKVTVDESGKTIENTKFTKRIKLNGTGDPTYRSIHFTVKAEGTLTVYATSGTASTETTNNDRKLGLYSYNGTNSTKMDEKTASGSEVSVITYDITTAGDYYIASTNNGINIYYIAFAYKPSEGNDPTDPTDPTDPEIPADSPILNANDLKDAEIKAEIEKNDYYTIIGTADAAVTIGKALEDGSAVTINEKEFTKTIKLGDSGNTTKRAIKITVPGKGKLVVYTQSSGEEDRTLVLADASAAIKEDTAPSNAGDPAVLEYPISAEGTYYLYSKGSGINIFYVEYVEGETGGDDNEGDENKTDTFYDATEGDSAELTKYNAEGFAASTKITGGGLLKEGSKNYYVVTNEKEFLDALNNVRSLGTNDFSVPAAEITPAVIEIKNDLNLGCKELEEQGIDLTANPAKTVLEKTKNVKQPLMHPTLKETGVSKVKLNYFHNLTIYSKNGASLKHCGISFEGASSNIIIRNITFDEFWEWDEETKGAYDRNDWDYMTVGEQTDGLWIDHCTFYKAYDGIIDVKGDSNKKIDRQRVTISWCEFLPGSKDNTFFDAQMSDLETNKSSRAYYKQLRDGGMSADDVWWYAYGQKKTHLFGSADVEEYASMIRVTMANNHYKNSMDRMPRLRYGRVHEYNCILDAQELYEKKNSGNSGLSSHITSNGAISTCGGEVLLENCKIKGIQNPLNSGNGTSPTGYINATDSLYYINNEQQELAPKKNGSGTGECLITDAEAFVKAIPYKNYVKYDASTLDTTVKPYAGAGKLDLSVVQWEKVSYGTRATDVAEDYVEGKYGSDPETDPPEGTDPDPTAAPVLTVMPGATAQFAFESTNKNVTFICEGAKIYYTMGDTESELADPADSANRQEYSAPIPITKETYIWAVAVKDGKTSEPLKCHYVVLKEGEVVKPVANPGSDGTVTPVASGTKVTLSVTDNTVEKIYYTTGSTPDDAKDPTKEDSGRQEYGTETEIVITEAVTIKAVALKGDKYSDAAVYSYTIKTDASGDNQTVAPPTADPDPAAGAVKKGTKVRLSSATEGAVIYYTTDGDTPVKEDKNRYKEPIVITEALTIKAFAAKDGLADSGIVEFAYTITNESVTNPDLSEDPDDPGVEDDKRKNIWITGLKESYAYTGAKVIPDIKVWDCDIKGNDRLLIPGVDYTVSYKDNTKPTTKALITITGKGNYVGKTVTATFKIEEANDIESTVDVKGAKIEKIPDETYTGDPRCPDFKLTLKDKPPVKYVKNTDFSVNKSLYIREDGKDMDINVAVSNNINKGTATILVSGKKVNGKTTSVKASFKITAVDLSASTSDIEVTAASAEYAVKGAIPASLTVKYKGMTLVNGKDYAVKYANNKTKGTGNITITGKGNYAKKYAKTVTYDIAALDLSSISVSAITAYEGIKAGKIKATVVDKDGNALKPAQYKLKFYKEEEGTAEYKEADVLPKGKIYVTATANDPANLTGTTPKAEFIVGKDISKAKFALTDKVKKGKPYTGSAIELKDEDLKVEPKGGGTKLKMGESYEIVSYSNNINKGTATAVIKGIGEYSGTKTIKFKITQKTMKKGQ